MFGYTQAFGSPAGATEGVLVCSGCGIPKRTCLRSFWIPNRGHTQVLGFPTGATQRCVDSQPGLHKGAWMLKQGDPASCHGHVFHIFQQSSPEGGVSQLMLAFDLALQRETLFDTKSCFPISLEMSQFGGQQVSKPAIRCEALAGNSACACTKGVLHRVLTIDVLCQNVSRWWDCACQCRANSNTLPSSNFSHHHLAHAPNDEIFTCEPGPQCYKPCLDAAGPNYSGASTPLFSSSLCIH